MCSVENTAGKRLKQVRNQLNMTQAEFAEPLGERWDSIRDIEIGKKKLSADTAVLIEKVHNINLRWLLTGQGEMFLAKKDETASREENPLKNASMKLLDDMNDEQIQKAYDYLRDQKQLGEFLKEKGA
jgi:DNA-binding XRE family transcriptional regulator